MRDEWVIAPRSNAEFVADMERVLEIYKRPYDARFPVVCFDEMPRQLIGETRIGRPMIPGHPQQIDYEYVRNGTCNVLMAFCPLTGWRLTEVTTTKNAHDWAKFTEKISAAFPNAEKIILVEDNLSTHKSVSWYTHFIPEKAHSLMNRFELVYTPKHGSWLNMAEIELHALSKQCLNRRIDNIEIMRSEVDAWTTSRNAAKCTVNWQFTTSDARIKLNHLYQTFQY